MLILPQSLKAERNKTAEKNLVEKTRQWLEHDSKDRKGIHASDLLNPRKACYDKLFPQRLSDRLVGTFFVGKTLHAFFLSAFTGAKGTDWKTDGGSHENVDLGITWSADWIKDGVPYEFKTSRSKYEQTFSDLKSYLEQLLIYMVGTNSTTGKLVTLMYNLPVPRSWGWGSAPQYRAYDVTVSKEDLKKYKAQLKKVADALRKALKKKAPNDLPLCKEFICFGCPHFERCKPEGRYGKKRFK